MKAAFRLRRKASSNQTATQEPKPEARVPAAVPRLPALSSSTKNSGLGVDSGDDLDRRFSGLGLDHFMAEGSFDGLNEQDAIQHDPIETHLPC